MDSNNINPALQDLKELVGAWEMTISKASSLPDLSDTVQSTASFEWFEDGEFLVLRQGTKETAHAT